MAHGSKPDAALLRSLPSVDALLTSEPVRPLLALHPHSLVAGALRGFLDALRREVLEGRRAALPSREELCRAAATAAGTELRSAVRPRINATGVLVPLEPGLGRAPLPSAALEAWRAVAGAYLSVDPTPLEHLACRLTGAEAALVTSNAAAALHLALASLAFGRDVVVASAHLLEVGGDFRVADAVAGGGARLREVGCTNRVHAADYERALPGAGAVLFVNRPNARPVGFVEDVPVPELVELARKAGVPLVVDQGSGVLVDLAAFGVPRAPRLDEHVRAGADVVLCSTDKLLGGPAGGLIVGRDEAVGRLRASPLARAVRASAHTLALLEPTLRLFLEPGRLAERHPLYASLATRPEELRARAERCVADARAELGGVGEDVVRLRVVPGNSALGCEGMGSGALATSLVEATGTAAASAAAEAVLAPVAARRSGDALLFDLRAVPPSDDGAVTQALLRLVGR